MGGPSLRILPYFKGVCSLVLVGNSLQGEGQRDEHRDHESAEGKVNGGGIVPEVILQKAADLNAREGTDTHDDERGQAPDLAEGLTSVDRAAVTDGPRSSLSLTWALTTHPVSLSCR